MKMKNLKYRMHRAEQAVNSTIMDRRRANDTKWWFASNNSVSELNPIGEVLDLEVMGKEMDRVTMRPGHSVFYPIPSSVPKNSLKE